MGLNTKSQSALEFMTIVGLGLILIGIASFYGVDYITTYMSDSDISSARHTINSIVSGVNIVYAQGANARTEVHTKIPNNIDRSGTYIYENEINLRFGTINLVDVHRNTKTKVFGSVPTLPGTNVFTVSMVSDFDGAVICLKDHDISCIIVLTLDDSHNFETNFSKGDNVSFQVILFDETFKPVTHKYINLQIYYPNKTLFSEEIITIDGGWDYIDTETLEEINEEGVWIISAMVPETKIVGNAFFIIN